MDRITANAGEKFTRIQIDLFVGKSVDAKRALYRAIVRRLQAFDVPAEDVKIVLDEAPAAALRPAMSTLAIGLTRKGYSDP